MKLPGESRTRRASVFPRGAANLSYLILRKPLKEPSFSERGPRDFPMRKSSSSSSSNHRRRPIGGSCAFALIVMHVEINSLSRLISSRNFYIRARIPITMRCEVIRFSHLISSLYLPLLDLCAARKMQCELRIALERELKKKIGLSNAAHCVYIQRTLLVYIYCSSVDAHKSSARAAAGVIKFSPRASLLQARP